jgi:hypothetical protein
LPLALTCTLQGSTSGFSVSLLSLFSICNLKNYLFWYSCLLGRYSTA